MSKTLTAIGMMSGTSLDGIDAAIIHTDGESVEPTQHFVSQPYDDNFRYKLRELLESKDTTQAEEIEQELTIRHADVIKQLLREAELTTDAIDVIGFHGQTIDHRPEDNFTWQIGDGALLASLTGIDVVNDFRSADIRAGGQGAPLAPLYHRAIAPTTDEPIAIVNIGGVANITYLHRDVICAFDTGPGNALIDDWMLTHIGKSYDEDGTTASHGTINKVILRAMLMDNYFKAPPPKSLDRNYFDTDMLDDLALEDGAATLTAFTAMSIAEAKKFFVTPPKIWYITGGGRHNTTMLEYLRHYTRDTVHSIEQLGYNPDALEAQAFAFLAVRSLYQLPLTLPETTGLDPETSLVTGGVFYPA